MTEGGIVDWVSFGAVLFDLDGVVTPTAEIHERAWAELFAPWGFDGTDYLTYVDGRSRYEGVQAFLASRGIELPWGDPSDPPGDDTVYTVTVTYGRPGTSIDKSFKLTLKPAIKVTVRSDGGVRHYSRCDTATREIASRSAICCCVIPCLRLNSAIL